jgi:hypothetical protein
LVDDLEDFGIVKAATLTTPNSIMVYGPAGKGKTVFAGSICRVPGFERTLVLDVEGSAVALHKFYPEVDVKQIRSAAEFSKIVEALLNGKLVERESGLPYQAVIIDTFDKAFERQLDVFAVSPERLNEKGVENTYFKWAAIKSWTGKVADYLHYADFLTIFILHDDVDTDEKTNKTVTGVLLQGKSQQSFPSVSDINAYFNMKDVKIGDETKHMRVAEFRPSDKFVSKQRFADDLNIGMAEPSMEKVFKIIEPKRFETGAADSAKTTKKDN